MSEAPLQAPGAFQYGMAQLGMGGTAQLAGENDCDINADCRNTPGCSLHPIPYTLHPTP